MRPRLLAALLLALPARIGCLSAEESSTRPATSQEVSEIQDYTRSLSKEWLKQYAGFDLDAISMRMRRRVWHVTAASRASGGSPITLAGAVAEPPAQFASVQSMDLRLEQYDDLRRLQSDLRDIPFAVRFDAESSFFNDRVRVNTSVFVPLSWKDELRAEARLPLPSIAPAWMEGLLDYGGFRSGWDLKGIYSNRLGVSTIQTGLGTHWMSIWSLNYEFRVRYGQDIYEESQWLRLGRDF